MRINSDITAKEIRLVGVKGEPLGIVSLEKAFESAEASVLQPFTYLQLFFASIIGIMIFNEELTTNTLAGGTIVVCSGIFAAWRNYKNNQKTLTSKI